jgi:hypothetical protein
MGRIRDCWRSSRGQNLVEFALIMPVVFVFIIGIIDFGMAMDHRIVLQHAAREGARAAAVNPDIMQVCDRTMSESHGTVARADISFSYEDANVPPDGRSTDAGDNVKITLPYEWGLPILSTALGGLFDYSIDLTATASARLERTVPGDVRCP